jgi:hypothetical protein
MYERGCHLWIEHEERIAMPRAALALPDEVAINSLAQI